MSQFKDFTSLPPDKEQTFVVYEKQSFETLAKAKKFGIIAGAIFGLLVIIIAFSFDKPKNKMADDEMGSLSKSKKADDAEKEVPKPDPPPAPAEDKAADPAPGDGAEGAAAGDEAADKEGGDEKSSE